MIYRRKKLLFTVLAVAVFLLLVEILIRRYGLDKATEESFFQNIFDPLTLMVPGAANPYSNGADRINRLGLRGPDFETKKAPGVFRIVCLGASSTFGLGSFGNSYPKILSDLLNGGRDPPRYEIINAGVPGTNIYAQRLLFEKVFQGTEPDLVLLMSGRNFRYDIKKYRDWMRSPFFGPIKKIQKALMHFSTIRFLRIHLKADMSKHVAVDAEMENRSAYQNLELRADYLEDLAGMKKLSDEWGFKLAFILGGFSKDNIQHLRDMGLRPDQPNYLTWAVGAYPDQEQVEFAKRWGYLYIDLTRDFISYDPSTPELWRDPNHAGNLGNILIAKRVAAEIRAAGLLPP